MHIHTFFSYNGEGWSPSRVAFEMKKLGLYGAAICDFDVLQGLEEFLAAEHAGQRLLLVTHGGALRAIFRHIVGLPAAGNTFPQTSNASYNSCVHSNNTWQMTCWNDTAHLNPAMLNELFTF